MEDKVLTQLESHLVDLKQILRTGDRRPLRTTWIYLQVYTQWGVRIPHTRETLQTMLNAEAPDTFNFFNGAVDAYTAIHDTCSQYMSDFDDLVKMGADLASFGKAVSPGPDYLLDSIRACLDDNDRALDALDYLGAMQEDAARNSKQADKVRQGLTTFKKGLSTAMGKLEQVKTAIETDHKTSQTTIDKLTDSDPENKESIKGLTALVEKYRNDYEHDVTVAATSPTYAWVNIPFPPIPAGLIAAVVVSAVYGKRAADDKEALDKFIAALKKAQLELRQALVAHGVQDCALTGILKATTFTDQALLSLNTVQNAWSGIASTLQFVGDNLAKCMKEGDSGKRLAAKQLVRLYLNSVEVHWRDIVEPLEQLVKDPYVVIQSGVKPLDQLLKEAAAPAA